MIGPGTGVRVYLACGPTDMRKGIGGLAVLAQDVLRQKPTGGAVFAFRGRKGDRLEQYFVFMPRASYKKRLDMPQVVLVAVQAKAPAVWQSVMRDVAQRALEKAGRVGA